MVLVQRQTVDETEPLALVAPLVDASHKRGFHQALAELPPAYFAMVMATGILAIACRLEKIPFLAEALLGINFVAYALLWALTLARAGHHPHRFLADFASHQRGPGFFTTVAATGVLGTELAVQLHQVPAAYGLWWMALGLWLACTYAVFSALTVRRHKPGLEDGINGSWLTAVVATQSLVVLGSVVMPQMAAGSEVAILTLVSLWLAGGMLYIWMISLIFYRYTFFRFRPQDLMPPYWINMGAMAISTLAGTMLLRIARTSHLLTSLLPFLKGFTLLYWATASWWIPMLVILGVWRYIYRKVPLTYGPLYWGAVFPLSMYTVATYRLADTFALPALFVIPRVFIGIALTAWLFTFFGLLVTLVLAFTRAMKRRPDGSSAVTAPPPRYR